MAHYHLSIKTGGKGRAADHADYILREGRFSDVERYGAIEARGVGNLPHWARADPRAFWVAADTHERANGNAYREFVLALPRELEQGHQIALAQRFIESELGSVHAYQWALHVERASDGGAQPHVHVMFSDRMADGLERGPERYFKRGNAKNPEKGGCLKKSYGENKAAAGETYHAIRARWEEVENRALEAHGIAARVDHRSLAAQGIRDREPGLHLGPAVAGIEARSETSQVGERQRQQLAMRQALRDRIIEQGLTLERERLAAERVAVRERRALVSFAAQAPAVQRAQFERQVESDRRVQLERAAGVAQRRTERREEKLTSAAPSQRSLFSALVVQARALQQRLGRALATVKEWVQERFQPWFAHASMSVAERLRARSAVRSRELGATWEKERQPARHQAQAVEVAQALEQTREKGAGGGEKSQDLKQDRDQDRDSGLER